MPGFWPGCCESSTRAFFVLPHFMRFQPNRDYSSDDVVMTPRPLAKLLVELIRPTGRILEPCAGDGAFLAALPPSAEWCEIAQGRDFLQWNQRVEWIITNPPWRQIRRFLIHSFQVADNVAFLLTINHIWTKARLRDAREAGFGISDIYTVATPRSFPQSGFQMGMVVYRRNFSGPINLQEVPGQW